jgi:hypothetical protein
MLSSGNFVPGAGVINRQNRRQILNRYNREIQRLQSSLVSGGNPDYFCECFAEKVHANKSSYRNSQQSANMRTSALVTNPLGGRTVFGQGYTEPVILPLRNKF